MEKVLVIGNKPYYSLPMNNVLDRFPHNVRCGMAIPNDDYNNGTIFDQIALSNHLYERLIFENISLSGFLDAYDGKPGNTKEYLTKFYISFLNNRYRYNRIFWAQHQPEQWNNMLEIWGCPHRFSHVPRVGQDLIFQALSSQKKVYVANFSLYDKIRVSHGGFTYPENWDEGCHSKDEEINILFWMHRNKYVDATLCMLEDTPVPTLRCKGLTPSLQVLQMLKSEYGDLKIIEE